MVELAHRIEGDRVVITLDPGQPIELHDLSASFAALARIYERHYRTEGDQAPKLYVTRLETGSIIMEIAPYLPLLGGVVAYADTSIIVADFTNRLWRGIKAFSNVAALPPRDDPPPREDAADLREFTKPLLGKSGAALGIKHARYEHDDGTAKTMVEYNFDATELNQAADNMANDLALPPPDAEASATQPESVDGFHPEVWLFLEQANRGPGKESGRTADRGVIPDISEKAVPVYFRRSVQGLKDRMLRGEENPFSLVFVVTVHVQSIGGQVQGYTVTEIHDSFPREAE